MSVRSGLDILSATIPSRLAGARVGVLANQSAVDSNYRHVVDLLSNNSAVTLVRLFAPEHGFRGEHQDMAAVSNESEGRTGRPIISLYGKTPESLRPKKEQLSDLDFLIIDLPDVGSRYYTFAQTAGYCLEAAAEAGTTVLVLDRPNPISGSRVEGSTLLASCRSFCGYLPVPQRHGLSLGELCVMMNNGFGSGTNAVPSIGARLEVIKAEGWNREQYIDETSIPWVIPSPNMPTLDTAIVYPGGCLIEATEISEGRGTTKPFEIFGAPGIDTDRWQRAVIDEGIALAGATLRPIGFLPQFQKHSGTVCRGFQLHVTDRDSFQPFRWFLALLFALRRTHPELFRLRHAAYEFVTDVPAIDLLYGSPAMREALDSGMHAGDLLPDIEAFESAFRTQRAPFLLYDEAR